MAEEAFARFSSEYTHFFPRGDMKQLYAPFVSIAQLTNHSYVACLAAGAREEAHVKTQVRRCLFRTRAQRGWGPVAWRFPAKPP